MKISCIYITARTDFPMIGLPTTHQFTKICDSLQNQTFNHKDFELIIVDLLKNRKIKTHCYGEVTRGNFDFSKYDFKIKHIEPKQNHWIEKNRPAISAMFNTGFIHADGELIQLLGDCSEYVSEFSLEKIWNFYKTHNGKEFLRPTYSYKEGGKPLSHLGEQDMVNKWYYNNPKEKYMPTQLDGCGVLSMDAILEMNGFNEIFDGMKGLEDSEMNMRLTRANYKFFIDKDVRIIENSHIPIYYHGMFIHYRNNLPMIEYCSNHNDYNKKANTQPISEDEWNYIIKRHKELPDCKIDEDLLYLKEHPPIFDLKELRKRR